MVTLVVIVASSATVTLLEASVLYGRIAKELSLSANSDWARPGRWLFVAGATLVPSLLMLCTLLPWVLISLVREVKLKDRTQEALQRARSMLERAEHVAQVGHWSITFTSRAAIVEASDSAFRIWGYRPQSFVLNVEKLFELYHPEDRPTMRNRLTAAIELGESLHLESRIVRADSSHRLVVTQVVAERQADGRVASVFGVIQDVSDEREQR
ncbi:MAG: PAS domain-containing protein, partial [Myxococcales bacterium]|nr:PAS domain-containing protein [Myxococcales bacterium]